MKWILTALILAGCVTAPIEAPKEESKVEPTPTYSGELFPDHWPKAEFRAAAIKALQDHGGALLTFSPKDKAEWCWKNDETPVSFYNRLFSAIAKFESNYKPDATYLESFRENNGKGERVLSTGLMQNSRESCTKTYKFPATKETLKDPYTNLACSAKIFARWVPSHGVIAQDSKLGGAIYYSTLRGWIKLKDGRTVPGKRRDIKAMVCQ